jgi:hypothetical protein
MGFTPDALTFGRIAMSRSFALASVVVLGTALAVPSFADGGKHWVAGSVRYLV